jgi:hypothetical protein
VGVFDWVLSAGQAMFAGSGSTYAQHRAAIATIAQTERPPAERYALQRAYYANSGLYERLAQSLYDAGVKSRAIRGLRNPAFRIVEAYPAHLWPGDLPEALPIVTDNDRIKDPIQQMWAWGNWARRKQLFARDLAMLGDMFIKVVAQADRKRVYLELIDPSIVTEFDTDERGNITYIRIDQNSSERVGDTLRKFWHVEIWSKEFQSYRRWEREHPEPDTAHLGTPTEEIQFSGYDFVPLVHCQFRDIGAGRGVGAFWPQIEKIDQVNAEATRLSQMLFRHNNAILVLAGGTDPDGRGLPAPTIGPTTATGSPEIPDDSIISIPGGATVQSLVPNLNYEAHRLVNSDGLLDLQQDAPEMAYWKSVELGAGQVSGVALRYTLGPFIKRVQEVRGNAEDMLARADMMALTLGGLIGAPGFQNLGAFDQGDFEHTFEEREVIALSDVEDSQAELTKAQTYAALITSGFPPGDALQRAFGYTEDQAADLLVAQAAVVEGEDEDGQQ